MGLFKVSQDNSSSQSGRRWRQLILWFKMAAVRTLVEDGAHNQVQFPELTIMYKEASSVHDDVQNGGSS